MIVFRASLQMLIVTNSHVTEAHGCGTTGGGRRDAWRGLKIPFGKGKDTV